jgi:hypothetical protein
MGVPKALGLTTKQWVHGHLGGYVKMSVPERREAVKALTAEGHDNVAIGEIVGVGESQVRRDKSPNGERGNKKPNDNNADDSPNGEPIDVVAALAVTSGSKKEVLDAAKRSGPSTRTRNGPSAPSC